MSRPVARGRAKPPSFFNRFKAWRKRKQQTFWISQDSTLSLNNYNQKPSSTPRESGYVCKNRLFDLMCMARQQSWVTRIEKVAGCSGLHQSTNIIFGVTLGRPASSSMYACIKTRLYLSCNSEREMWISSYSLHRELASASLSPSALGDASSLDFSCNIFTEPGQKQSTCFCQTNTLSSTLAPKSFSLFEFFAALPGVSVFVSQESTISPW